MKILINTAFGGFALSTAVLSLMFDAGIKGIERVEQQIFFHDPFMFERNDPKAIDIVEKIGVEQSSGPLCSLAVVEIPDDTKRWIVIESYGGKEQVLYGDFFWNDGYERI